MNETSWRKLHPLSPIMQGGLVFVIILGILFANLRDRIIWLFLPSNWGEPETESDEAIEYIFQYKLWIPAIFVILGLIVLIIGSTWLSWRFHTFRITDEAVETRKGVLSRKSRRAPLDRIQSVNLQRPLLARILGLTKIDIQTGGQGGNAQLAYLAHAEAKKVRDEILRSAARTVAAEPDGQHIDASEYLEEHLRGITDEDVETLAEQSGAYVRVPVGRLIGSTLLSNEAIIFVLLVIATPIAAFFWGWGFLAAIIPGVIVLVGVSFGRFNKGFRFTLSATTNGVRTGSGLTATSTETIPLHRIHAIDIAQHIAWRPFGWWRVRVTTAGTARPSGAGNNQGMYQNILLPVGKTVDIAKLLELLAHYDETLTAESLESALTTGDDGFVRAPKKAAPLLLFGLKRAGVKLEAERERGPRVLMRRGFIIRHLVVMPLGRAQSVLYARPMMHYMLGLAYLQIHTVMGPVNVTIRGLERHKAAELAQDINRSAIAAQKAN